MHLVAYLWTEQWDYGITLIPDLVLYIYAKELFDQFRLCNRWSKTLETYIPIQNITLFLIRRRRTGAGVLWRITQWFTNRKRIVSSPSGTNCPISFLNLGSSSACSIISSDPGSMLLSGKWYERNVFSCSNWSQMLSGLLVHVESVERSANEKLFLGRN